MKYYEREELQQVLTKMKAFCDYNDTFTWSQIKTILGYSKKDDARDVIRNIVANAYIYCVEIKNGATYVKILKDKIRVRTFKYLLNVTFCAGSDDEEDVDRGLFIIETHQKFSFEDFNEIFANTNKQLSPFYEDENNEIPFTYDDGLNIDTLMKGVAHKLECKISKITNEFGRIEKIENYYKIEQWQ